MAHDIFISYSSKDKPIADAVCANLESAGMRCWIAPRDIAPGMDWPTAISNAIAECRVMVLIFSANSNTSSDVGRELILAANNNLVIVPFKLDNITPEPGKQYYLARTHWLDAMNPPTQEQIDKLVGHVRAFLGEDGVKPIPPAAGDKARETVKTQPSAGKTTQTKRKNWVWISLASLFLVAAVVFSILYLPRLAQPAVPTPTLTATRMATATHTPTFTDLPTETHTPIPGWVTDFAEPILLYKGTHAADQRTDFDEVMMINLYDMLDLSGCSPEFDYDFPTIMTITEAAFLWKMWYTDFILEMDVRIVIPGENLTMYYRGDATIEITYDGYITMSSATNELGEQVLVPRGIWNQGDFNNLVILVKDQSNAVVVNGQPMLFSDLPSGWKNGITTWHSRGSITFDQISVWDLSE